MTEYNSVEEMVTALCDDSYVKEFIAKSNGLELSRALGTMRMIEGLSEKELGERVGWSEDEVVKLEHQEIREIRFADMFFYFLALGYRPKLSFSPKDADLASQVKLKLHEAGQLLNELIKRSGGVDEKIDEELGKFLVGYFAHILSIFPKASRDSFLDTVGKPYGQEAHRFESFNLDKSIIFSGDEDTELLVTLQGV